MKLNLNIKRLHSGCVAVASVLAVSGQNPKITAYDLRCDDKNIIVEYTLSTPEVLKADREALVVPVLRSVDANDSVALKSLVVAGRSRYFTLQRHSAPDTISLYRSVAGMSLSYVDTIPLRDWMKTSRLDLVVEERGCCGEPKNRLATPMAEIDLTPAEFTPQLGYIKPTAVDEVKTRTINGKAFIDFPVNITEIRPAYRKNPIELAKINATIDSVKLDSDITIDSLTIKGFASPEGSYSNNIRLARGRTAALKQYVQRLHRFNSDIISTSYEPEDWEGLRRFVEGSGLEHRAEILALIDSNLEPDAKDAKIKKTYPSEYAFLLSEVYPALRHSDYTVKYTIRTYTDPEEILRLVKTAPQKLSMNEFCLAASTLKQDSKEYEDLWETAVRMYPTSEVAIVNAANAAISRGHLDRAGQLLDKAGDNPDAIYTKGNLAAAKGDYGAAKDFFARAAGMKVANAPEALEKINAVLNKNKITRLM